MQPQPDQTTLTSNTEVASDPLLSELSDGATLQVQLAQATLLLAETRHHCRALVESAQAQAMNTIADGRATAERIIADARAQTTHVDVRERSSSMFGDLWSELGEHHDPDAFFDGFRDRHAEDIFKR